MQISYCKIWVQFAMGIIIPLYEMPPLVLVQHLSKHFGNFKAVDDLSFSVNEGDVYGFLGQNGAGKSTSIRMMLSLIKPTGGEVNIFGYPLRTHRKVILSQTGCIIEKPDMYLYLSAYDNLSIFARMSRIKPGRQKLMQMLEFVGLKNREHDKVKTFSQGMKQRLGIAVSLIHDPRLVILDEPANGLDPQGISDIRQLIIRLSREQGKTVIISSHLLSEIEMMANRMIIIDKGKKIVEGEVSVLLDPAHTIVQLQTTETERAISWITEKNIRIITTIPGNSIQMELNRNQIPELIAGLSQASVPILDVHAIHSLEHYFLSLTNPPAYV